MIVKRPHALGQACFCGLGAPEWRKWHRQDWIRALSALFRTETGSCAPFRRAGFLYRPGKLTVLPRSDRYTVSAPAIGQVLCSLSGYQNRESRHRSLGSHVI